MPNRREEVQCDRPPAETNPIAPPMQVSIRPWRTNKDLTALGSAPSAKRMLTSRRRRGLREIVFRGKLQKRNDPGVMVFRTCNVNRVRFAQVRLCGNENDRCGRPRFFDKLFGAS